jgi:hypothetical protein
MQDHHAPSRETFVQPPAMVTKRTFFRVVMAAVVATILTAFLQDRASPAEGSEQKVTDTTNLLRYLVQAVCTDGNGAVTQQLPFDVGCIAMRPMKEDDVVRWRKHDWGGAEGPAAGWQASDAVLANRDGIPFVDQTFDFGAPATDDSRRPDAFYRFDANDGGDAIIVADGTASVFLTQDGGSPGLQWFIGPDCGGSGLSRYLSWVLFRSDADVNWRSLVARLAKRSTNTCPTEFSAAFTRYKLVSERFPVQWHETNGNLVRQSATLPTIISEHFGRATIASSEAMERFYYAKDLGKIRWEAWSTDHSMTAKAEALSRSGRCPALADSAPPDDTWNMLDCRMWTNIVIDPERANWRVHDFDWPPSDVKLRSAF